LSGGNHAEGGTIRTLLLKESPPPRHGDQFQLLQGDERHNTSYRSFHPILTEVEKRRDTNSLTGELSVLKVPQVVWNHQIEHVGDGDMDRGYNQVLEKESNLFPLGSIARYFLLRG